MFSKSLLRALVVCASILVVSGVAAASASADTVTAGNQIFSGKQCFGNACSDPETYSNNLIRVKATDTPGTSFVQTNGGGFTAQTWDVAGNEANFFIRDVTGGSRLPFRIFPGALTNTLRLNYDSTVSTYGILLDENASASTPAATALDTGAILTNLKDVVFSSFRLSSEPADRAHFKPTPTSFNTAFGLGTNSTLSPTDVGTVALAGVQQLNAKVDALPQTPDSTTGLAAANAKIAALEAANKKILKSLASLNKKVKKLSKRR